MPYGKRYPRSVRRPVRRSTTTRKKTTTRRPRVSYGLKSYVKRAISRTEEVKCQNFTANNVAFSAYAAGALTTLDSASILGLITQGVGEGQRIGCKVTVKSLIIRGFINQISSGQLPVVVKMFVGVLRNGIASTQNNYANLYQAGSTVSPPQNNLFDSMRAVNKDLFNVYNTKTFKIGQSATAGYTNNDFSYSRAFSVNVAKHMKTLIWNDAGVSPVNKAVYVWFTCSAADGTTSTTCQSSYGLSYDWEIKYTDA